MNYRFNNYSRKNIRIFWFSILFTILIIVLANPAQSQVTLCYPDCPNDVWNPMPPSPALTYQITLPCGEPVIVHYRTRIACGAFYDLFIEEIEFLNGYAGGQHCGQTMTVSEMLEAAMVQMMIADPMRFPPDTSSADTCVDNYRVMVGGCWKPTFPIGVGGFVSKADGITPNVTAGLLYPCVFVECCIDWYTVCIVNHQKVITYNSAKSTPGYCDPRQYQLGCYPACQ